jgi:putative nucleotidyltransferase with HDIG domain
MFFEKQKNIAALVLAAGYSSRMGDFKPLLPLGRSTVVREVVERFRRAGIEDVRVVAGHRAGETGAVVDSLGAKTLFNADYPKGMYSSILAGVKSLEPEIEAFFVLPVDVPLVKPATLAALAGTWRESGAGIVYPRFEGLRGHPPLVAAEVAAELPQDCDGGLAAFLGRYEDQALDCDVIDQSILMNCNTRRDYLKLCAHWSREDIPTERECMTLLKSRNAPEKLVAHCRMVAEVAGVLAVRLEGAGLPLDLELVKAAGLLHDIAKGEPDHAAAGAALLEESGYGRVARIVAVHTDIEPKGSLPPDEADVVHLADKLVQCDRLVSLEERFEGPLKKFANRPEVLSSVKRRLRNAKTISDRLADILDCPPETLVRQYISAPPPPGEPPTLSAAP